MNWTVAALVLLGIGLGLAYATRDHWRARRRRRTREFVERSRNNGFLNGRASTQDKFPQDFRG